MRARNNHWLAAGPRQAAWIAFCLGWIIPSATMAQGIAEGGSPLYYFAVHESLLGLRSSGKPVESGKGQAAAIQNGTNQPVAIPAAGTPQGGQVCPICGKIHPLPQTAGLTNSNPAVAASSMTTTGLIAGRYYYCPKCKVYHQSKQTVPLVSTPLDQAPVSLPPTGSTN